MTLVSEDEEGVTRHALFPTNPHLAARSKRAEEFMLHASISALHFEAEYAERSKVTPAYLRAHGRIVLTCDCGDPICQGWRSVSVDALDDLPRVGG